MKTYRNVTIVIEYRYYQGSEWSAPLRVAEVRFAGRRAQVIEYPDSRGRVCHRYLHDHSVRIVDGATCVWLDADGEAMVPVSMAA